MTRGRDSRAAKAALRAICLLVPGDRRAEWLEEWEAELEMLEQAREAGRAGDYPGAGRFVAGSLPHAVWIRTEG